MIPQASEIETQILEHYGDGAVYETGAIIQELAGHFKLTELDLAETDGSHPRFYHKVHTALARHCKLELLVRPKRSCFRYLPKKVAEYKPRHHRPRTFTGGRSLQQETKPSEDQFPVRDFVMLSEMVARNGKDKVLRVLKDAF